MRAIVLGCLLLGATAWAKPPAARDDLRSDLDDAIARLDKATKLLGDGARDKKVREQIEQARTILDGIRQRGAIRPNVVDPF
jgi:hypothetical protein